MARASLRLGLILVLVACGAEGQTRLGNVPPGGVLHVQLQDIVPLSRLRVEIDGTPVDANLAFSGRTLLVTLPDDLQGRDHDIVIFRVQPDTDTELGVWSFSTPTGQVDAIMAGTVEIERQFGAAGQQYRLSGNGRLGFDLDDGLLRGGFGFVETGTNRRGLGTEITDYFLETRQALFGQDLVARLGMQYLPAENLLLEDGAWRGASLRLTNPDGRGDVMAFALQPGDASGHTNLSGLENPDARLIGIAGQAYPFGTSSLRTDVVAFDGRADLVAAAGNAAGKGLRLSGPIAADIGDFSLDYARSETQTAGSAAPTIGQAWAAELGYGLLGADSGRSLELRFGAEQTDAGFFSPLNPDLIADESRRKAELLFLSDQWQWNLSGALARSNITDDPDVATDAFREFGLDLTYSPYVFTGGFLQGVTFYGSAYSEDQTRLYTPTDGASAQDFRLQSLSFGMDRFRPDHAWALGVKLDWLQDLTGAAAVERGQRIEASLALTPDDLTSLTFSVEGGRREKAGVVQRDATVDMTIAFPLHSDLWSAFFEVGGTWIDADATKNGHYFGIELQRELSPATALLLRADYGQGAAAGELTPGQGWTFGLALRHELSSSLK